MVSIFHSGGIDLFVDLWEAQPCLCRLVENKVSSPMDEEEIKIKMDDGVDTSLGSEETDLFIDLLEAQNDIVVS